MVSFVYPSCIETPRAESPVNTGRSDYRNPAPSPRKPSSPQHPTATNQLHIREKLTSSMSRILQGCVGGVMCCVALLCFRVGIGVLWLCRTAWDRGSADAPPIPRSPIRPLYVITDAICPACRYLAVSQQATPFRRRSHFGHCPSYFSGIKANVVPECWGFSSLIPERLRDLKKWVFVGRQP